MRTLHFGLFRKNVCYLLLATLTVAFAFSCRKSNTADVVIEPKPVIAYKQKIISVAEDVPMAPVKPDSTGGPITGYSVSPSLPKGFTLNKVNGEISGTPSDTLMPTKFVVMAAGPGGTGTDTITLSVGTVGFSYGATGIFTLEKGTVLSTPISPVILAGIFKQFLISSPYPDSLTIKTGNLTFSPATGQVSGSVTKLTSATEVPMPATFEVTGISTSGKAATASFTIFVNDKKPAFSYPSSGSSFSVGTATGNVLTPTNNLDPVNNVIGKIVKYRSPDSAALRGLGLSLDSTNGRISGTPNAAANRTIVVRGLNTGGSVDVTVPLVINATPVAPQVAYLMSWISNDLIDTLCPRITSGGTVYLTKSDNIGQANIYLNPVVTAGQPATTSTAFTTTAFTGEGMSLTGSTGLISGTPAVAAPASSAHAINIANAATGGLPAGSFTMNIVYNAPFFTYNSGGIRQAFNNSYNFIQGQPLNTATGTYPGYTTQATPAGGTGVVSYTIYPNTANTLPFSSTGLSFNSTTGAISGTPSASTMSNTLYTYWDYIVQGKKTDGSFTIYKIRIKIFRNLADWENLALYP
jgi:hypothetical protein